MSIFLIEIKEENRAFFISLKLRCEFSKFSKTATRLDAINKLFPPLSYDTKKKKNAFPIKLTFVE